MASMVVHIFLIKCKLSQWFSLCGWLLKHAYNLLSLHRSSVNIIEGDANDRQMTTGMHTVRDIYCCKCGTVLGWKYV